MFCIQRPVSSLVDEDSTKSSIHEDQVKIGMYLYILYLNSIYTLSSNHNIHKSSCGLCFLVSDPLIDRFY